MGSWASFLCPGFLATAGWTKDTDPSPILVQVGSSSCFINAPAIETVPEAVSPVKESQNRYSSDNNYTVKYSATVTITCSLSNLLLLKGPCMLCHF